MHTPHWQVSAPLQTSLSAQLVPLATGGFEHKPVAGSHTPAVWQLSTTPQVRTTPAEHTPAVQTSPVVQAFPSEQRVPSGAAEFTQRNPVEALHKSKVQGSWSSHVEGH